MKKLNFISFFVAFTNMPSCEKNTNHQAELPREEKSIESESKSVQNNQKNPAQKGRFPNVKLKPDSTWEDADLNDLPDRLKAQIESDVNEARNK